MIVAGRYAIEQRGKFWTDISGEGCGWYGVEHGIQTFSLNEISTVLTTLADASGLLNAIRIVPMVEDVQTPPVIEDDGITLTVEGPAT
jgi:hypothetical protein